MTTDAPTAKFWHALEKGDVQCELCPHECTVSEGKTGICRVRGCVEGELRALGYGKVSSCSLDPIEKKPLYHFLPGADILSVGGWGCNLRCTFCQNWDISQGFPDDARSYSADDLVKAASSGNSVGIAYTYNEPLIAFEFVENCATLVHAQGMKNILVTNGFVQREPAARLLPLIDALNVDIKSMKEDFYRTLCGGSLAPVLEFCKQAREAGCHLEVTNLIIPGHNDEEASIGELGAWVATHLGATTPLHLSAYFPRYKLGARPTPTGVLSRAREISRQSLDYVYIGNVATAEGQNTDCPGCGETLASRRGYRTSVVGVDNGACRKCGRPVDLFT